MIMPKKANFYTFILLKKQMIKKKCIIELTINSHVDDYSSSGSPGKCFKRFIFKRTIQENFWNAFYKIEISNVSTAISF